MPIAWSVNARRLISLYWHSLHTGRVGAKVFYKTGIEDTSFLVF